MGRVRVEVVYALKERQQVVALSLEEGACAIDAARASGLFPPGGSAPDATGLGIHGRLVAPDTRLGDGDRVEIYRPLALDPKEARRRRASGKSVPKPGRRG